MCIRDSTVPIGTARLLESVMGDHGVENVGVASTPEFLAQGNAVEGSRRPDRVVVGADTAEDMQILRRLYSQFVNHVRIRYLETTPETAEAIKYMSNTLLLTYISFWNGVGARLAEAMPNIRMEDLKIGVTSDARISTWGSYVSNGAGGSCFGKDIQSLIYQMNHAGRSTDLLQAVHSINEYQKTYLIDRAIHEAQFSFNQKTVALLGLAFKKRTNDMRDSAAPVSYTHLDVYKRQVMHAFDFNVSFFALMLMNGVVNLATTLPSAPGYIGTFDGPGIAVLTLYGVDPAVATAYTLTLHAALWLPRCV